MVSPAAALQNFFINPALSVPLTPASVAAAAVPPTAIFAGAAIEPSLSSCLGFTMFLGDMPDSGKALSLSVARPKCTKLRMLCEAEHRSNA